MKRFWPALLLFLLAISLPAQRFLNEIREFGTNPGKLKMFIHKPYLKNDTVKRLARKPLVVVLHGCNQEAEPVARQSGWNKLADKYDFYVLYPAQRRINNPSGCFNWFFENDMKRNSGECGSIRQMIQYMCDSFLIDTTRIFVYGMSAGAAMTSVMLANYPDLFNAGAVLAGGPYKMAVGAVDGLAAMVTPQVHTAAEWGQMVKDNNTGYKGNYPRLVVCHGKKDKVVNPKNSMELIKQWSNLQATDTVPAKTLKAFAGTADVEKKIYCDKSGAEKIFFYDVANTGHTLIIDPGTGPLHGGETGLFATDKDFFSTYWIAKDFGLIP